LRRETRRPDVSSADRRPEARGFRRPSLLVSSYPGESSEDWANARLSIPAKVVRNPAAGAAQARLRVATRDRRTYCSPRAFFHSTR
jgi:hypothetical protein